MTTAFARYKPFFPFILITGLALVVWIGLFNGLLYDDAYIAFRYSSHWAEGLGPVWNAGENPVEGYSSFAWVLIGTLFQLVGLMPHIIMPWVGVASWVIAMIVLLPKMADAVVDGENSSRIQSLVGGAVVVSLIANAAIGFQAFHGLETALFSLAILLVAYIAVRGRTQRDYLNLALASLFLFTVRPDGAAIVLPVWGFLFLLSPGARKQVIFGGLAAVVLIGAYTGIKWAYYGHPFPNTFYIKESTTELAGMSYVQEYVLLLSPLLVFLVYAAGRVGLVRTLMDRIFMTLIAPALVFTVAYIGADPILGNIYRFVIPTLPLFLLAGLRLHLLAEAGPTETPERTAPGRGAVSEALVFFVLAIVAVNALSNIKVYKQNVFLQSYFGTSNVTRVLRGTQLQAANQLSPAPLLATGDVGAVPYFSDLPTMDIIGLSDEVIAHDGLTHEYALSRRPDLLVLQDFYYTGSDLILMCGPQGYVNPELNINDKIVSLNMTRYTKVLENPEREHNGKGSTYQIVTMPGFAEDYAYIMFWDLGGDRYHVFVRRAYPQFDALVEILKAEP